MFLAIQKVLEDFLRVPPSHMKVLPDHYQELHATSKGHPTLLIIHNWNWHDLQFKISLPKKVVTFNLVPP